MIIFKLNSSVNFHDAKIMETNRKAVRFQGIGTKPQLSPLLFFMRTTPSEQITDFRKHISTDCIVFLFVSKRYNSGKKNNCIIFVCLFFKSRRKTTHKELEENSRNKDSSRKVKCILGMVVTKEDLPEIYISNFIS